MEDPYATPLGPTFPPKVATKTTLKLVGVASLAGLCAFAAYLPMSGVRGALFCMFPGVAQRSVRVTSVGVILGFVTDVGVTLLWMIVGGVWEPRWGGYNKDLTYYIPPIHVVATHVGSPMPNSLQLVLGLVLWSVAMYAIWMALWHPKLKWSKSSSILVVGAFAVGTFATVLWTIAPLTVRGGGRYQPFGEFSPKPFIAILFAGMPICSINVASLIYFRAQSKHPATASHCDAEQTDEPERFGLGEIR